MFSVMLCLLKQHGMLENVITQEQRSTLDCSLQSERRGRLNWKHMGTADASLHFDCLSFSLAPCHRNSPPAFFLPFNIHTTPLLPLCIVSLYLFTISSSLCLSLPLVIAPSSSRLNWRSRRPSSSATHSIDYATALPSHFNSAAPLILLHSPPPHQHSMPLSPHCAPRFPPFSTLSLSSYLSSPHISSSCLNLRTSAGSPPLVFFTYLQISSSCTEPSIKEVCHVRLLRCVAFIMHQWVCVCVCLCSPFLLSGAR